MTVDNGFTNHEPTDLSGELARINEDEISRQGAPETTTRNGNDKSSPDHPDLVREGSLSLRELLHDKTSDPTMEPLKQTQITKPGKETEPESWSLRNLLGSYRSPNDPEPEPVPVEMTSTLPESGASSPFRGSPLRAGSPLRGGSPYRASPLRPAMKKLLTPQLSLARIRDEMDEKSRMVKTPSDLAFRDGINLPMIGQVKWEDLKAHAITWLKDPKNLVLLVWIIAVAVSGAILFMVMVGMLNAVLPKKSDRDLWFEISNQILNALFTLMALYNHPTRILHLIYLIRYNPTDIIRLRQKYCKDGQRKPHEWAHIMVVVLLLHLNCVAQYALCGLNWGYRRSNRPAIGVGITLLLSFGAAAAAGIYNTLSPLGKDYHPEGDVSDEELMSVMEKGDSIGHSSSAHPALFRLHNPKYKLLESRKSFTCREGRPVQDPQWEGGLFTCHEEPTISVLSVICFPCVMGFNYERLGFGNRYVHMVTFLLLLGAPFLVFSLAAINIDNSYVRTSLGVAGYVLCIFSLLYGGFWRIKIRERYKLPATPWCCNQPNMSDCFQWLFCSFCSLCQEVRTAESYDVRNDRFFVRTINNNNNKRRTSGASSPDWGCAAAAAAAAEDPLTIAPLPSSPMVHIKDKDSSILQEKPVDLTAVFPPTTVLSPPPTPHMAHNA